MDFSSLEEKLRQRAQELGDNAAALMQSDLIAAAPVGTPDRLGRGKYLPGQTKANTSVQPGSSDLTTFRWVALVDVPYAEYREKGSPAHVIRPRGEYNLVFYWERMGFTFAGPSVNHPGNPAMPWFGPITDRWSEYLRAAQ